MGVRQKLENKIFVVKQVGMFDEYTFLFKSDAGGTINAKVIRDTNLMVLAHNNDCNFKVNGELLITALFNGVEQSFKVNENSSKTGVLLSNIGVKEAVFELLYK